MGGTMRTGGAFLVLVALAVPARADQLAPVAQRLELREGEAVGVSADGIDLWRIAHPAIRSRTDDARGPVVAGGRTVYAVRGDLIEADLIAGRVVARTRFPALIHELTPAPGDEPAVDVLVQGNPGEPTDLVIRYRLGAAAPGRGAWSVLALTGTIADADGVAEGGGDDAIARLAAASVRDPLNPHLHVHRGLLLRDAGRAAEADQALDAGLAIEGAPWSDWLRVSRTLEDHGDGDRAERAFQRGFDAMLAAGVRPERVRSLLGFTLFVPRDAMREAIAAGDVARADRIATRVWKLSPHGEGSRYAWLQLAAWLRGHGRADLAEAWDARAADGGTVWGAPKGSLADAWNVDLWVPPLFALLLAAPLVALLIGLRRGADSRDPARRVGLGHRAVDLAAVLLPLCAAMVFQVRIDAELASVGRLAASPVGLYLDAVEPGTPEWLRDRLAPSSARDRYLAYTTAELDALRAGGRAEVEPPDVDETFTAAFSTPDPLGARIQRAFEAQFDVLVADLEPGWLPALSWRQSLIACAALFALGLLAGRVAPRLRLASDLVPGGAASLGPFAGLVTGGLLYAAYELTYSAPLAQIAIPSFAKYYGLDGAPPLGPELELPGAPTAAVAAVVIAILLQLAASLRDRRLR